MIRYNPDGCRMLIRIDPDDQVFMRSPASDDMVPVHLTPSELERLKTAEEPYEIVAALVAVIARMSGLN